MRYKYIDYTKGFGILMIMLAHVIQYFPPLKLYNLFIGSFHVPIFFVVAGCLAYCRRDRLSSFKEFIRKRTASLLIPWLFFSLINSFLKLAVLGITDSLTSEVIHQEIVDFLIIGNGTVWFLTTLFCVELVFWILKRYKITKNIAAVCMLALVFMCLPYTLQFLIDNPFGMVLVRAIAGLGYLLIGFCFTLAMGKVSNKNYYLYLAVVLLVCDIVLFSCSHVSVGMMAGIFKNFPYSLISSLLGSCGFILLFVYLDKRNLGKSYKVIEYFGKNSLLFMVVHPLILNCFTFVLKDKFSTYYGVKAAVIALALWFALIIIGIPCVELIQRKLPWLIGKRVKQKE